jgi:hypothetical protein
MTSPRDYYLTPEEMGGRGNAILRALSNFPQQYESSKADILKNALEAAKAKYAPENERENALEKHLNNLILQPKAEKAKEFTDVDLLHKKNAAEMLGLQNQYYAPNILSEIAARQATTNRTNQLTPLEVIEQQLKNSRTSQLTPLEVEQQKINNKYLAQEKQSGLIKQALENSRASQENPLDIYKKKVENAYLMEQKRAEIENIKAQANYRNQGGAQGSTAFSKNEKMLLRGIDDDNPQLNGDPEKIREARNVLTSGGDTLSDGTKLNPMSKQTSDAYSAVAKTTSDVGARQQQRFANTLETVFKIADKNADKAFQYAGVAGKAQQGFDAFTAQSGRLDPNYEAFQKFVTEDVPAMVTEIVRTGGANSTNAQKAVAIAQAMPINMKVNPKLAKSMYEELKKIYRAVGKTVSKGVGETLIELNRANQGGGEQRNGAQSLVNGINNQNDPFGLR